MISLILPWLGVALLLAGAFALSRNMHGGWTLIGLGLAAIVSDIAIDLVWAHPAISPSDHPDLNLRGAQLVGRTCLVVEPVRNGRGKVCIGDTVWIAEGADLEAGAHARVTGCSANSLLVTRDVMAEPKAEL